MPRQTFAINAARDPHTKLHVATSPDMPGFLMHERREARIQRRAPRLMMDLLTADNINAIGAWGLKVNGKVSVVVEIEDPEPAQAKSV